VQHSIVVTTPTCRPFNLTAGVIVLDVHGHIQSGNLAPRASLRALHDFQSQLGQVPGLEIFAKGMFWRSLPTTSALWPRRYTGSNRLIRMAPDTAPGDNAITLIARGAKMPGTEGIPAGVRRHFRICVRPARTGLGEVVRRLAHEIKNCSRPSSCRPSGWK
jgi:hypothetical protein